MAQAKRPVGVTFIAICNLVFGLPCLCCLGFASTSGLMDARDKGNDPNAFKIEDKDAANNPLLKSMKQGADEKLFVTKEVPHLGVACFVMYGIGTLANLLLFVSGVVLLLMRNWGRWLCILGAVLLLANCAADVVYSAAFVLPASQKFHDKQIREGKLQNQDDELGPEASALLVPVGFLVLSGGYSVLAIAVMLSGASREAFAAANRMPSRDDFDRPPENYDAYEQRRDDFDDRYRPGSYDDER